MLEWLEQRDVLSFIELAPVAVFGVGQDGQIIVWNDHIAAVTGLSKGEVIGKNVLQVLLLVMGLNVLSKFSRCIYEFCSYFSFSPTSHKDISSIFITAIST